VLNFENDDFDTEVPVVPRSHQSVRGFAAHKIVGGGDVGEARDVLGGAGGGRSNAAWDEGLDVASGAKALFVYGGHVGAEAPTPKNRRDYPPRFQLAGEEEREIPLCAARPFAGAKGEKKSGCSVRNDGRGGGQAGGETSTPYS
jgi:hypothetical protein